VFGTGPAAARRRPYLSRTSPTARIQLDERLVRHHVRGSSAHDASVHGHAWPPAVERVERDDRVTGRQHRAAALLRLDSGVRGPSLDAQAEVHDALARRRCPVGACALDQGHVSLLAMARMNGVLAADPIPRPLTTNTTRDWQPGTATRPT
jgi:hypothetical protein